MQCTAQRSLIYSYMSSNHGTNLSPNQHSTGKMEQNAFLKTYRHNSQVVIWLMCNSKIRPTHEGNQIETVRSFIKYTIFSVTKCAASASASRVHTPVSPCNRVCPNPKASHSQLTHQMAPDKRAGENRFGRVHLTDQSTQLKTRAETSPKSQWTFSTITEKCHARLICRSIYRLPVWMISPTS